MKTLSKKVAWKEAIPSKAEEIKSLKQYQASSRKDRDIMWLQHQHLRQLFNESEHSEVFLTDFTTKGLYVRRFKKKHVDFFEYQTFF